MTGHDGLDVEPLGEKSPFELHWPLPFVHTVVGITIGERAQRICSAAYPQEGLKKVLDAVCR